MIPENEIIRGCIKGDRYYQNLLYKTYSSRMLAVCMRYFKQRDEAEDCLQEGFVKVFKNIHLFGEKGSFEGWIRKIMVNTAINIFRANQRLIISRELNDDDSFIASDEHDYTEIYSADYLMNLIQNLPDGYRVIFNMYAIEGYSHKEISEIMNISEGTSKSQLSRARALLQEKLNKISKKVKIDLGNAE